MNYLLDFKFTNDEINEIEKNNSKYIISNLIVNKNNVIELIQYFEELGLSHNTIKELFLYQIGIFFRTKKEVNDVFNDYEIDSIVKSLNFDVNTIDLIEFS